ncbi:hypothetical protein [Streptomyces sp. NBC_01233]|uniref:hypothetical protein n=1 Tax=Streptomyces sp. NBC_01233 TaxID=2903787 RepID=UPI002E12FCC9|nr:hypothetical protein OG332_47185 [Streptomyces sp. NBC_01233]
MEDVAAALGILAGALAQLDPECAEILAVVPVAAAAVVERAEQAGAGTKPGDAAGGRAAAGASAALRQAPTARGLTRHRVHQFGAALVTVTLNAAAAQALAVLLAARLGLPRQAPAAEDEPAGVQGRPRRPRPHSRWPWPPAGLERTPGSSPPDGSPSASP